MAPELGSDSSSGDSRLGDSQDEGFKRERAARIPFGDARPRFKAGAVLALALGVAGALATYPDVRSWVAAHVFVVFAVLPGLVGIVSHYLVAARHPGREAEIERIDRVRHQIASTSSAEARPKRLTPTPAPKEPASGRAQESSRQGRGREGRPRLEPNVVGPLFGSLCLVVVYLVPTFFAAREGDRVVGLGYAKSNQVCPTPTPTPESKPPAPATPTPSSTPSASPNEGPRTPRPPDTPTPPGTPTPTPPGSSDRPADPAEGRRGLIFASYGAYIFMIRRFASRISTSTITGKFLLRMAFMALIAQLLGYVIGELGAAPQIASSNQAAFLYFLVGLFPGWAEAALRRRGRALFSPDEPASAEVPLNFINGIDDDTADRLAEIGIWNIQHLACSNPTDVIDWSLYPANRVLDWIDQAILISYFGAKVTVFRELGIRSSIELALLYEDHLGVPSAPSSAGNSTPEAGERKTRACALFKALAQKASIAEESLLVVGRYFYEDATVDLIWRLWQDPDGRPEEPIPA